VSHRFPLTSRLHRSRTAAEDRSRGPQPRTAAEDRSRGPQPRTASHASCGFRPEFRPRCHRASARLIRCCFAGVYCAKRSKRNKRHKSSEFPRRLIQTHFTDTCRRSRSSSTAPTRSQAGSSDPPIPVPRSPEPSSRRSPPRLPRDAADDPGASPKLLGLPKTNDGRPLRAPQASAIARRPAPFDAARGFAGTSAILGESPLSANNRSSNLHLHATACSR